MKTLKGIAVGIVLGHLMVGVGLHFWLVVPAWLPDYTGWVLGILQAAGFPFTIG